MRVRRESQHELGAAVRPRSLKAGRREKGRLLDECVASTGDHRRYALTRRRRAPGTVGVDAQAQWRARGGGAPMDIRGIIWVGTATPKHREMAAFLGQVLGLPQAPDSTPEVPLFTLPDGATLAVMTPAAGADATDTRVVGFRVADLDAAIADLERAGAEVLGPLFSGPRGRWQHFRAPDGWVYELIEDGAPAGQARST
jgi:predicted enzyme related to lactoylglutathione lyase